MARTLLVTGGSRGIGAAICRLGAERGYNVAIVYNRQRERAEAVLRDVEAFGRRGVTIQADTSDPARIVRMFDETEQAIGKVDAFVSNSGIIHKGAPLVDIAVETIREILDTDLTAHIIANREAVRRMSRSRGGSGGAIVNISSRAAPLFGTGGFIPYAAAKGGIDTLTAGLGREAAGDGVRVNGVRPGLIDTDMQRDTGIEDRLGRFGPSVPIGRSGTTEEVAEAVLWLLSDQASYVTSTIIDVSGGR
ncbi:MAG: SDR family oxidoreductase [Geminicoccaceae bacterium]|nr:SDR family oxidoreductase [Geminicoccaceae bacterium]